MAIYHYENHMVKLGAGFEVPLETSRRRHALWPEARPAVFHGCTNARSMCYYEINSFSGRRIVARIADGKPDTVCPVARSLDIVGDKWTVLVLRELYMGVSRFEELQIQTEATPQMLAGRLKALEADGMIERHPYNEKPLRYEYRLTRKGWAFYPVIYALRAWGEGWCKDESEGVAVRFVHCECGADVGLANVCPNCGAPVTRNDLQPVVSGHYAKEREERRVAFKSRQQE
ncbi:winged helix-turn-helix transcriptional regulator [Paraburkholderia sp. 2C]